MTYSSKSIVVSNLTKTQGFIPQKGWFLKNKILILIKENININFHVISNSKVEYRNRLVGLVVNLVSISEDIRIRQNYACKIHRLQTLNEHTVN